MTNDHSERADDIIVRAARDYNEPGAVPREQMWARIAEARRTASASPSNSARNRRARVWVWPSIGVAAAGLVAVGVAIGRGVERSNREDQRKAEVPVVPHDSNTPKTPPTGGTAAPIGSPLTPDVQGLVASASDSGPAAVAFRLAVVQHVVGSEAMITEFRAAAHRGDVDPQLAKWSRDLLGETRLLESSAPPGDLTMKRLLQDLDLVLAQIVQYTNHDAHAADDLDLIERSLRRRAVMSNLRTLSAGRLPSGT